MTGAAGRASPQVCEVYRGAHRPRVVGGVEVHHIWPRGMAGPETPDNLVAACPTCHQNIHRVLAALVFGRPVPGGTRRERRIAAYGYQRWVAAGRPGNPHAAYGLQQEVTDHG